MDVDSEPKYEEFVQKFNSLTHQSISDIFVNEANSHVQRDLNSILDNNEIDKLISKIINYHDGDETRMTIHEPGTPVQPVDADFMALLMDLVEFIDIYNIPEAKLSCVWRVFMDILSRLVDLISFDSSKHTSSCLGIISYAVNTLSQITRNKHVPKELMEPTCDVIIVLMQKNHVIIAFDCMTLSTDIMINSLYILHTIIKSYPPLLSPALIGIIIDATVIMTNHTCADVRYNAFSILAELVEHNMISSDMMDSIIRIFLTQTEDSITREDGEVLNHCNAYAGIVAIIKNHHVPSNMIEIVIAKLLYGSGNRYDEIRFLSMMGLAYMAHHPSMIPSYKVDELSLFMIRRVDDRYHVVRAYALSGITSLLLNYDMDHTRRLEIVKLIARKADDTEESVRVVSMQSLVKVMDKLDGYDDDIFEKSLSLAIRKVDDAHDTIRIASMSIISDMIYHHHITSESHMVDNIDSIDPIVSMMIRGMKDRHNQVSVEAIRGIDAIVDHDDVPMHRIAEIYHLFITYANHINPSMKFAAIYGLARMIYHDRVFENKHDEVLLIMCGINMYDDITILQNAAFALTLLLSDGSISCESLMKVYIILQNNLLIDDIILQTQSALGLCALYANTSYNYIIRNHIDYPADKPIPASIIHTCMMIMVNHSSINSIISQTCVEGLCYLIESDMIENLDSDQSDQIAKIFAVAHLHGQTLYSSSSQIPARRKQLSESRLANALAMLAEKYEVKSVLGLHEYLTIKGIFSLDEVKDLDPVDEVIYNEARSNCTQSLPPPPPTTPPLIPTTSSLTNDYIMISDDECPQHPMRWLIRELKSYNISHNIIDSCLDIFSQESITDEVIFANIPEDDFSDQFFADHGIVTIGLKAKLRIMHRKIRKKYNYRLSHRIINQSKHVRFDVGADDIHVNVN